MKRFSLSFNKAKAMGIVDEDLVYIFELKPDKYRVSIRSTDGKKVSKVVYGIMEAIKEKWRILKEIEESKIEMTDFSEKKDNGYSDLTVDEGFKLFFKERMRLVEHNQIELSTYEDNVMVYSGRYIKDNEILKKKIKNIDKKEAQKYVDWLYAQKPLKEGKDKLSVNTIANPFKLMNGVFNYFKDELEIIEINPFTKIKNKPKYKPKNQNYLITEEIKIVLNALDDENIRFKALINLFLETGLRIEEITALKWCDLNKFRQTISIHRALIKSKLTGKLIIKDVKTDGSERDLGISEYAFDFLYKLRKFKENCGQIVTNDDFIFSSWDSNELIGPNKYSEEWRKFIKKLGFEKLPLKNLRHTIATFMLQGETNIEAVKKRFGWTKDSTVMGIYNQSGIQEDRMLVRKFEETFRNTLGLSFADLYRISVNRFSNKRKLVKFIEDITNAYVDDTNFEIQLNRCQKYLFELYPVFEKISYINNKLDDEEIDAMFDGFKNIYKQIKITSLNEEMNIKI